MKAGDLPELGLFSGVAWSDVEAILSPCPIRRIPAGTVLAQPGQVAKDVWLVLEGTVAVHVHRPEGEPLARLGPGECVGELAAIDRGRRSAWIVAERPTQLVEIDPGAFRQLIEGSHLVSLNLLQLVAGRIRQSNHTLANAVHSLDQEQRRQWVDPLTGLLNRRWLDQQLPLLVRRATHDATPMSLAMVDIDHFKRLNDTYGHPAGDQVLHEVAQQMRRRFRPRDYVVRYGGEEFTVVLPDSDLAGAVGAADRVRQALAFTGVAMTSGDHLRVTVSAGVAQLQPDEPWDELVARADRALYRAKSEGRNRVVPAEDR
ncbi:MAG: GGDEF domain-containing protein [Myxococcales bacterium]|nr:GGDEF domain-containing protein [Myxococcales bacterium]